MTEPVLTVAGVTKFMAGECWKYALTTYHGRRLIFHAKRIKKSAAKYTHHRNAILELIAESPSA